MQILEAVCGSTSLTAAVIVLKAARTSTTRVARIPNIGNILRICRRAFKGNFPRNITTGTEGQIGSAGIMDVVARLASYSVGIVTAGSIGPSVGIVTTLKVLAGHRSFAMGGTTGCISDVISMVGITAAERHLSQRHNLQRVE